MGGTNDRQAAMTRKWLRLAWLAPVLMVLIASCGGPNAPAPPRPAIIPETTKVSDDATRTALTSYDPDTGTMRFASNTSVLASLEPDDVLVSVPSAAAPNGYLRKVKVIRQEGDAVVLETTQANLTDAIAQGDLDEDNELEDTDLQSATALVDGLTVGLAPQDAVDFGDGYSFRAQFNETVLDIDDGDVSVQVKVSGDLYFNAGYHVGIGIDNINPAEGRFTPEVDRFEAWIGFEQAARLRVWGEANAKLTKEKKVAEYRFTPQCFTILVVPVCFVPTVYVFVGATGEVHLSFDYSVEQTASAKIGAKWDDEAGWSTFDPTPSFDTSFDQSFDVAASLGLSAWTKAEGSLMLFGVAGPTLGVKLGISLDAAIPRDPFWILSGSLEGYYGFIVDLPVIGRLAESHGTIFDITKEFGRSPNAPPTIVVKDPTNRVDLGDPLDLGFHTSSGNCDDFYGIYCVLDPETGVPPYTLTSNVDGVLPHTAYTFGSQGLRTVTVRATDGHGATSSATFTVDVINTPPVVYGSAGSGTVQRTVPYFVSAAASDPNSKLDCSALTWSVTAPDTVEPLNVATDVCYGRAVFNVEGNRSISLKAQDPQGAVSPVRTFAVYVTAPPPDQPPDIDAPLTVTGNHYTDNGVQTVYGPIPYGASAPTTDNPLTLSAHATDPEHPDDPTAITYTFSARCTSCPDGSEVPLGVNNTGTLLLTSPMVWYPGDPGGHQLRDGGLLRRRRHGRHHRDRLQLVDHDVPQRRSVGGSMRPSPGRRARSQMRWVILASLPAIVLVACRGGTSPSAPTFTITLQPLVLNLHVTDTAEVTVLAHRSGGFAGAIAVTLEGEAEGLAPEPLTITGDQGVLRFVVTDDAKEGTSFPTVKAVAAVATRRETLTLHIEGAVAKPVTVLIKDNDGSSEVRQGSGDVLLEITGSNLERTTAVTVGDLDASVLERSSANLEVSVMVPHGAPLGGKDLTLSTAGGDTTFDNALIVTAITAGPEGKDGEGSGTHDAPYRTLRHALAIAQAGDTVRLLDGAYSAASGETWPQVVAEDLAPGPNVPIGVRVEGESTQGVMLEGPGALSTPPTVGLAFAGDGAAADLTVTGFARGFDLATGDVTLDGVHAQGNGVGLDVRGGTAAVQGGAFAGNDLDGIAAAGAARLELSDTSAHDNAGAGVHLAEGSPTLQASRLEALGNLTGVVVEDTSSATLEDSELHDNAEHGLEIVDEGSAEVRSSELHSNGLAGLWFAGRDLEVRGTTIRDNHEFGAYIEGEPERVDFGSFSEAGGNDLHDNGPGTADQLLDARPDRAVLGDPEVFTLSATELNGVTPAPDIYPPDGSWPYFHSPYFSILGQNNFVHVYTGAQSARVPGAEPRPTEPSRLHPAGSRRAR